jgi:hypothetical protein
MQSFLIGTWLLGVGLDRASIPHYLKAGLMLGFCASDPPPSYLIFFDQPGSRYVRARNLHEFRRRAVFTPLPFPSTQQFPRSTKSREMGSEFFTL